LNDPFAASPVVPVVVLDDAARAAPVARALVSGGLPVLELTLRTPAALAAIEAIARGVPDAVVGAGTVLSPEQARQAVSAGARFIVSPGLHEPVVAAAQDLGVPVVPGAATATEVQRAWNLGLRVLKFFPAELAGGLPLLEAFGAVFGDVRFMPTGGVSAANLPAYLRLPNVASCGGSWVATRAAIAAGDYDGIAASAAEALRIARTVRG